jgi:dihydrofolate reductase
MTSVLIALSTALDGFIAGADDSPEQPLGVGGDRLFTWLTAGDTPSHTAPGFKMSAVSAAFFDAGVARVGAVIAGRRTYDVAEEAWGGNGPMPGIPLFVVTHHAPETVPAGDPPYTFISDGIHRAVAQARTAAAGKDVFLQGASIAECLGRPAGLLRGPGPLDAKTLGVLAGGTLDLAGLCLSGGDDLGRLGLIHYLLGLVGRVHQHLLGRPAGLLDDVGHMGAQVAERRGALGLQLHPVQPLFGLVGGPPLLLDQAGQPAAPFLDLSAVKATPHDLELGHVELGLGEWRRLKGTHLRGAQRGTSLRVAGSKGNAGAACSRWAARIQGRVGTRSWRPP